jgi:thiosulfate/3-mercaptopyruvate sulfurtransferase
LYDPTTKTLANPDDAERQFAAQGVTREKQVIAYCGGGISATIDLLLLRRLGTKV